MNDFDRERIDDYLDWLQITSFHHASSLGTLMQNRGIVVEPCCGFKFSTVVNSPEDVIDFISHFTEFTEFERLGLIELAGAGEVDTIWPCYITVNRYDYPMNIAVTRSEPIERLKLSSITVNPDLDYPAVLTWQGEDSFDRFGNTSSKVLTWTHIPSATGTILIE